MAPMFVLTEDILALHFRDLRTVLVRRDRPLHSEDGDAIARFAVQRRCRIGTCADFEPIQGLGRIARIPATLEAASSAASTRQLLPQAELLARQGVPQDRFKARRVPG
ncbi:MAG: hypothetical protein FJX57_11085 [Alphaproteobacteria bacterium]|nr:hypothetical protein [Alphaproteobacteria bacterium]